MSEKIIEIIIDPDTAEVEIHADGFIMGGCVKELEAVLKMVQVEREDVKEDDQEVDVYQTNGGW